MARTTLVLMGHTGNGKSATANSILGKDAFLAGCSPGSLTKQCKLESCTRKDGRIINIVDTPGLFDTDETIEFTQTEIVKCIDLAKDGMHGVLFVVSAKKRFSPEEAETLDILQMLFGPKILNYMVVAFTGGDKLEKNGTSLETFLEKAPKALKDLVRRCNSRAVLFDNKTTSVIKKEKQITKLSEIVDGILAYAKVPYSNELFNKAQELACKLPSVREREMAYASQVERLRAMLERNMRETEEKIRESTKILEERVSLSQKEADALREELNRKVKTIENIKKKQEEDEGCCRIS